jgi:hypothetical protein
MKINEDMPKSCSECNFEVFTDSPITKNRRRECSFTEEATNFYTNCRSEKCPLKDDGYLLSDLDKEDLNLINGAMKESALDRSCDADVFNEDVPGEVIERTKKEADRLIYLVNVIKGIKKYE